MIKPILLCVLSVAATGRIFGADGIVSKTTYAKAYGETKNPVAVDPAKDLPRYPVVEPKDAIATWQVKKGFKLELAANEPEVRSPIALSYDERGRMFVCEMIDYSEMRDVTPHLGRISMLEDKDGDGHFETSTVFADNLAWPTGVICANGGIYVIATPDVWFFKDTDGDGKADVREVVYTGFGTGMKLINVQGMANCPTWGLDNRIHIQGGPGNKGLIKCLKRPELKEIEISGHDLWFDPRTLEFGLEAGGGQYGMSFDNYGRRFVCSNSDHLQYYLYDEKYAQQNPYFSMPPPRQSIAADGGAAEVFRISPDEPWRIIRTRWRIAGVVKGAVEGGGRVSGYFTGATGTTIYRGDAYGDDFINNSFTGDAGGQLVHRKKIRYADDGINLVGERPADEHGFEFAASKDTWVRVVNFANAPDGCLNVIDMHREVIEHPWSIPDEIKKYIDLNSGNDRGRIFRIVPENFSHRRGTKVNLADASVEELVNTLGHPNGWHRDTAARLLYERNDKAAVRMLEKLFAGDNPLAKIHALGVLEGARAISDKILIQGLSDEDAHVREAAVGLCGTLYAGEALSGDLWKALSKLTADSSLRVRFSLALTLGVLRSNNSTVSFDKTTSSDTPNAEYAKFQIASGSPDNAWITAAVLNGSSQATRMLENVVETKAVQLKGPFLNSLLSVIGRQHEPEGVEFALRFLSEPNVSDFGGIKALQAFADGLRKGGTSIDKVDVKHRLTPVFAKGIATALDNSADEAARVEAIDLIGMASSKEAEHALGQCMEAGQPDAVQTAAVKTLALHSSAGVTSALTSHLPRYGVKAKEAALTALTARDDRTLALLEAVQSGAIKATDFSASQVQALVHHKDGKIAAMAKKVLASVIPPSREEVVAKFKDAAATQGDATRGQAQYLARCMACHKAGTQGIQVGPDLVTVKTKGRDGILSAILEPNKEVAAQYIAYTVTTKDGQTLNGIIVHDDASSLTLRLMGGIEQTIQRSNIKGTSSTGTSLMPEGLETGMSVQDMADLLSFVEGVK